jgi:hypothetical protein
VISLLTRVALCWALGFGPAFADGYLTPATITPNSQRVLGQLRGANFNVTTDQAIAINATVFQITSIVVTNCSASLTLAVGGFYSAASKGGTPIVAATQVYSALTASTVLLNPTVAATPLITRFTVSSVFLSLTTAQGAAATCDVYIVGIDLT